MKLKKYIALVLLSLIPLVCFSESMSVGKGDYQYSDGLFKSKPDETERVHALNKAKSNAILAYADTLSGATRTLFEQKRAQFLSNPDRYIIRYNVAKETMNKESRMFSVIIEAIVDDAKIKNDIGDSFGSKDATLSKNNIVVFFVAREVDSTTSYEDRVTNVVKASAEKTGSASGSSEDGAVSQTEGISVTTSSVTGGSVISKSDDVAYRIDKVSCGEFGAFLTDVFTEKGMDNIIDGAMFDVAEVMQDVYSRGDNIGRSTWDKVKKELRDPEYDIKYVVVGTVDLSSKEVHKATGKPVVSATVSARIYKIDGKLVKIVSSLNPITVKGLGSNQSLAKKNALSNCAKDAADEIVDKLRVKGLL